MVYKEKKKLISARRDEAPVSAAAPATTEKHQETTTQLNTPSLFNYCHIITAIYLHLLHSHSKNTHRGEHAHRDGEARTNTHGWGWITKDTRSFILHITIVKLTVWCLLATWHERETQDVGCLAEKYIIGLLICCGSKNNYIYMPAIVYMTSQVSQLLSFRCSCHILGYAWVHLHKSINV